MINKLSRSYKKLVSNKKGLTLIQLLFALAVVIVLAVILNPIDLFNKVTRGRETAGWSTDLSNLSNNTLSNRERYKMLYSVNIKSTTPPYDLTVAAPPVGAYDNMQKLIVEKSGTGERTLTYDKFSTVKYAESGGVTPLGTAYGLYDFKGNKITETGTTGQTQLLGLSHAGSNGIAPFINLSIPKVEESLFLGMLGGKDTELGKDYEKNKKFTKFGTNLGIKDVLKLAFGTGNSSMLDNDQPDRWITLNLMDTKAIKEILGSNSRFLDQDRYRLYWVSNVVTESEALVLAKNLDPAVEIAEPYTNQKTKDVKQLYDKMSLKVLTDTIVVMPTDKNDRVYSEFSDFKLYKFTTAD